MTMIIGSPEREILRALYEARDWLDLYILHERYLLSPGQLSSAVRKFEAAGIVVSQELKVRLTDRGIIWLLKYRKSIFMSGHSRPWAKIRSNMRKEPIDPFSPYLPTLKFVDENFFSKK